MTEDSLHCLTLFIQISVTCISLVRSRTFLCFVLIQSSHKPRRGPVDDDFPDQPRKKVWRDTKGVEKEVDGRQRNKSVYQGSPVAGVSGRRIMVVSAYAGSLSGRVVVTRVGVHSWLSQNAWSELLGRCAGATATSRHILTSQTVSWVSHQASFRRSARW